MFEPFGDIEFVDLHMDYVSSHRLFGKSANNQHGRSSGTAYVQFRELRSAQMALDAMNGL